MTSLVRPASGMRKRGGTFDLAALSPTWRFKTPDYSDGGGAGDTWTATVGTNATGSDTPRRTASSGAPAFDYNNGAGGEVHLTSAVALSTWGGAAGSDRHWCVRVDLAQISTVVGSLSANAAALVSDSGAWTGIHLRHDGAGQYYCGMYHWDTASRTVEANITSLLSSGNGPLVVQAKKEGGSIYLRLNSAAWSSGVAVGNIGSTAGHLRLGYRLDGTIKEAAGWTRALTSTESDNVATYLAGLA